MGLQLPGALRVGVEPPSLVEPFTRVVSKLFYVSVSTKTFPELHLQDLIANFRRALHALSTVVM